MADRTTGARRGNAGPARASHFSWRFTARTTLDALEDAAKG